MDPLLFLGNREEMNTEKLLTDEWERMGKKEIKLHVFVLAFSIKELLWPAALPLTTEDQDEWLMRNVNEYPPNKELF